MDMKYIKSFLEAKKARKKKEEKVENQGPGFNAETMVGDENVGFKSKSDEVKDAAAKKIIDGVKIDTGTGNAKKL
jgi:hypothetical protein